MILELPEPAGKPDVAQARYIAPNATICGNVTLGRDTTIWFDAVLRAEDDPIVIGDETNVQDHVMVHIDFGHPVHIGSRVTIGHNAVVHGCTVEDDVLIGMNATILNDAHVGKGSLVAAGALVLEGQVIPPNSLVAGVPAKVKKVFTAQEVEDRQNYYIPLYLKEGADYAATMGSGVPEE